MAILLILVFRLRSFFLCTGTFGFGLTQLCAADMERIVKIWESKHQRKDLIGQHELLI